MKGFTKITPVNGFDATDPNNAMQNNYAWSMAELGDHIYVGTGRNILYLVLSSFGIEVPDILRPDPVDLRAEIWRYNKNGNSAWERVYKVPADLPVFGLRFMIRYTSPAGETALYAGAHSLRPPIIIFKSTDGVNWKPLVTDIQGTSTRTMVIHNGLLYMGVLTEAISGEPMLYESSDPERNGWKKVDLAGDPDLNPRGGIDTMVSFNNQLYLGTSPPGGFELWRTTESSPTVNNWRLVADRGAGDALNEVPLTLGLFRSQLYVGSAIALAVASVDPEKRVVPPKGADLVRVNPNDQWQVIAGGKPIDPAKPVTGARNIGKYPSGFGDLSNAYIWQLQEHEGLFYLGTFDWSVLIPPLLSSLFTINRPLFNSLLDAIADPTLWSRLAETYNWNAWLQSALKSLPTFPATMGFDLYQSPDGINWTPLSLTGLGNPRNYGLRTLCSASDGKLYLGTANPFQGCEVWVKD